MISVICSVYNSECYLADFLPSLNLQTLQSFEVVFVDAGSSDRSLALLKAFRFRSGITIKIIELQENITIYSAWNKAIAASAGVWIINYNTDDYLFPEALSILHSSARDDAAAGVIYTPCLVSSDMHHQVIISYYDWPDANIVANQLMQCCCGPFPLVRKECFRKYGAFDESYFFAGDYEMWCRLLNKGVFFRKLGVAIGVYFYNPSGISTRLDRRNQQQKEAQRARLSLTKQ